MTGVLDTVRASDGAQAHEVNGLNAPQLLDNVVEAIGHTPLVRLNRVTRGIRAPIYAKLEFMNPGGSVKDRIGISMIEAAEREGTLKPGGTIVEATSGNTGVGLAIAAAVKGYKVIFVMPDKMSAEKVQLLRAFGAKVIITPTAVLPDDPRSYYSVAKQLAHDTPNAILAGQYNNPANAEAHYHTTGPEIWRQTSGKIDVFVAGMGTGGTISGSGRYLKEQNPNVQVVGVDIQGSLLYDTWKMGHVPEEPVFKTYKLEGIGEDFVPGNLDLSLVDDAVQVDDRESFLMTRRLVREEGIFCGGSSGAAVAGVLKYARNLPPDKLVVVLLPDSGSRYLSKIFNDDWMRENGFLGSQWGSGCVADILRAKSSRQVISAHADERMTDVITTMKHHNISQVPVIDDANHLLGLVTELNILDHMLTGEHKHSSEETIEPLMITNVPTVTPDTPLEILGNVFASGNVAIVLDNDAVCDIVTKIDLIDFLAGRMK